MNKEKTPIKDNATQKLTLFIVICIWALQVVQIILNYE